MEFIEIDFYNYKIRMCVDNGIRMYLVSNLLRQYNEKHNTNKRFTDYLKNKQTQEVVEELAKSVRDNSTIPSNGSQDDQNTVGRNSDLPSNNDQNGKFNIQDVI